MSPTNTTLRRVIETLYAAGIICRVSFEEGFEYLEDDLNRDAVDRDLRKIGRALRTTHDNSGYFAVYVDSNEGAAKTHIRANYSELVNDIEPLIRWLRATSIATRKDRPLQVGDVLRGSELIASVESAPQLVDEVERLSRSRFFNNQNTGPTKQIEAMLRKLCERGYLVPSGPSGSKYLATAMWSRLYDVLHFISAHEDLEAGDTEEQGELLT